MGTGDKDARRIPVFHRGMGSRACNEERSCGLQLAHVAWPVVSATNAAALVTETGHRDARAPRIIRSEDSRSGSMSSGRSRAGESADRSCSAGNTDPGRTRRSQAYRSAEPSSNRYAHVWPTVKPPCADRLDIALGDESLQMSLRSGRERTNVLEKGGASVCALQGAHRIAGAEQARFQVGIELRAPEADKRRAAANALAMDQPGQSFLADAVFTRNQYADRRSRRERDILPQFARGRTGSDENSCYFTRIEGA